MRVDLLAQGLKEAEGCGAIAVDAKVGQNEWAEQPSPHRALVIGAVSFANAASVVALVAGLALRETAQSLGSDEAPGAEIHDEFLSLGSERALRQRNRKNLIGT